MLTNLIAQKHILVLDNTGPLILLINIVGYTFVSNYILYLKHYLLTSAASCSLSIQLLEG
jgi:hypothetical protein